MDPAVRAQLEMDIAAIGRDCPAPHARPPALVESALTAEIEGGPVVSERQEPFGLWLRAQRDRGDWIDDLARAAREDPGFPKAGDPEQVRNYLSLKCISDSDVFEQVDDAERVWLSL